MKRRRYLRHMSPKKRAIMKQYAIDRVFFLAANPLCQCCPHVHADQFASVEVHHRKGRGPFMLVTESWLAVCAWCHVIIHLNPGWCYANGIMINRCSKLPIVPVSAPPIPIVKPPRMPLARSDYSKLQY